MGQSPTSKRGNLGLTENCVSYSPVGSGSELRGELRAVFSHCQSQSELEATSDVPMEGSKEGSGLVALVHVRPCVLRLGSKREEVTARCLEGKVSRERRDPLELRTELVEESGVEGRALLGVCRGR
jgi:hypothetical protein